MYYVINIKTISEQNHDNFPDACLYGAKKVLADNGVYVVLQAVKIIRKNEEGIAQVFDVEKAVPSYETPLDEPMP